MNENRACDLCGLDVGIKPFLLNAPEKQYQFCCEGCRGIYGMLHDIKETPAAPGNTEQNTSGKERS